MTLPQKPLFLPGSIRHNMTTWNTTQPGSEEDKRIEAALRKVGLWATLTSSQPPESSPPSEILSHGEERARDIGGESEKRASLLDADLDYETSLSHGQRQLFCLARMLFQHQREAHIVLLDEITSSVDHDSQILMQEILKEELFGKTVVEVIHRLDLVMNYDTVVVVDQRKIVEAGPPKELVRI